MRRPALGASCSASRCPSAGEQGPSTFSLISLPWRTPMRFGLVLLGTALVMTLAAPAAAQGTSAPKAFVGGLGGLTFGTATSSAIAGQVGVRITGDLFVIGEVGRMQD